MLNEESQRLGTGRLLSIEDAARQLGGVSPWTIRAHLKRQNLRSVRIGKRRLIPLEEVERVSREGLPPLRQQP